MIPKLIKIDRQLHDHMHLTADDVCYFMREYTARGGYNYSDTNKLIANFKKSPLKRTKPEYYYKGVAIEQIARELLQGGGAAWYKNFALVPAPPSKCKSDPEYDDRMKKVLERLGPFDVRELIIQRESREPFHLGERLTIQALKDCYEFDEQLCLPEPKAILICDDILTNGTHFKAIKDLLNERFPNIPVHGLFIARCVHITDDVDCNY